MMKIFNYFKNKKNEKIIEPELQFTQQQISYVIASLLLIFFFIFMAGYYLGKKNAIEAFAGQFESESLADKISYAFCSNYDYKGDQSEYNSNEQIVNKDQKNIIESEEKTTCTPITKNEVNNIESSNIKYLAELAGFGTWNNAHNYEKILSKNGYKVNIITRRSKTLKGKEIKWYQAITETYNNQNELLETIKKIKKVAPIKDVKVVIIDKQRKERFAE